MFLLRQSPLHRHFAPSNFCCFQELHIDGMTEHAVFCAWLFSLSIPHLRSTHTVTHTTFHCWVPFHWTDLPPLFSPMDGHRRSMTKAVDVYIQLFVCMYGFLSLRWIPRSGSAGPYCEFVFTFLRTDKLVSQRGCMFHLMLPPTMKGSSGCATFSPTGYCQFVTI